MTALVTPFRDGQLDVPALAGLVERQVHGGTDWIVAIGTTGESPTLSEHEQEQIITTVLAEADRRCGVMVGAGTNDTAATLRRARRAEQLGAQALMLVAPYYNRPTPEGLYRHFAAVAEAVTVPIVLYNVPPRTAVHIPNDVVVRLREAYPHVVAIKHATGSVDGVTDLLSRCEIAVLSGDDAITWPLMALGAVGVVSVISNIAPRLMKSLVLAARAHDMSTALTLHQRVYDLATELGRFGPNPVPIKTALAAAGQIAEEFRLPLCPVADAARSEIAALLRRHELLA